MIYITTQQLDREVNHPTIAGPLSGSIAKFIQNRKKYSHADDNCARKLGIEPATIIRTKFDPHIFINLNEE